jgi:hypothetical protein
VEDHSGGIDDAAKPWGDRLAQANANSVDPLGIVDGRATSLRRDLVSQSLHNPLMAELARELRIGRLVDEPAYGRQG